MRAVARKPKPKAPTIVPSDVIKNVLFRVNLPLTEVIDFTLVTQRLSNHFGWTVDIESEKYQDLFPKTLETYDHVFDVDRLGHTWPANNDGPSTLVETYLHQQFGLRLTETTAKFIFTRLDVDVATWVNDELLAALPSDWKITDLRKHKGVDLISHACSAKFYLGEFNASTTAVFTQPIKQIHVWKDKHPINYINNWTKRDEVLHLVPQDHVRHIRSVPARTLKYFRDHYRHSTYNSTASILEALK